MYFYQKELLPKQKLEDYMKIIHSPSIYKNALMTLTYIDSYKSKYIYPKLLFYHFPNIKHISENIHIKILNTSDVKYIPTTLINAVFYTQIEYITHIVFHLKNNISTSKYVFIHKTLLFDLVFIIQNHKIIVGNINYIDNFNNSEYTIIDEIIQMFKILIFLDIKIISYNFPQFMSNHLEKEIPKYVISTYNHYIVTIKCLNDLNEILKPLNIHLNSQLIDLKIIDQINDMDDYKLFDKFILTIKRHNFDLIIEPFDDYTIEF